MSKFNNITAEIIEKIMSGELKVGDKLPTEKELAQLYQVSSTTIVKALNELTNDGYIHKIRGSGSYISEREVTPIIKGRKAKIGILWTSHLSEKMLEDDFYGKITLGVIKAFQLELGVAQWNKENLKDCISAKWIVGNKSVEVEAISELGTEQMRKPNLEAVKRRNFDGLITVGVIDEVWLGSLLDLGIPTVMIDILNQKFDLRADQVYVDPIPGFREAIHFFHNKKLKRMHFVAGYRSIPAPKAGMTHKQVADFRKGKMEVDPDSYLRLAAYRQILDEIGVFPEKNWVHMNQPLEVSDRELALDLLSRKPKEIPEAIFCHGLKQAETILDEFSKAGRYIYATATTPDLDYNGPIFPIYANGFEMGAIGIELLISKIQRPNRISFRVGAPMKFSSLQN